MGRQGVAVQFTAELFDRPAVAALYRLASGRTVVAHRIIGQEIWWIQETDVTASVQVSFSDPTQNIERTAASPSGGSAARQALPPPTHAFTELTLGDAPPEPTGRAAIRHGDKESRPRVGQCPRWWPRGFLPRADNARKPFASVRLCVLQQRLPLSQRGIREAAFKDRPISAARPRLTIRCRAAG